MMVAAPAAHAPHHLGFMQRAKVAVFEGIQRHGFVAILLAASIPNPLFDLAGLTCGHVGIPFATFFAATPELARGVMEGFLITEIEREAEKVRNREAAAEKVRKRKVA